MTPKELTHIIAEGNPKLTLHKSSKETEPTMQATFEGDDIFYPVSKTPALLTFNMEMTREDDWKEDESERQEGSSGEGSEEKFCSSGNEENGKVQDLFIVSMMKTRISVLKARGGEGGCTCLGCLEDNCFMNDVIVVAESRTTVTLVSRGSESFSMQKLSEKAIQNVSSRYYLRGLCPQFHTPIYASPNPEKITIYYYKSNGVFRGMPVVLNFTGSNCFLRCCKSEEKISLQIGTCTKQSLQKISTNDPARLSFLFYMKSDLTKQYQFESALHRGWFIRVLSTKLVDVAELCPEMEEKSFLFIIQSD
ncbi:uncharacterized protein LOC142902934 isoform X2 [Nelusetta ayraudi]